MGEQEHVEGETLGQYRARDPGQDRGAVLRWDAGDRRGEGRRQVTADDRVKLWDAINRYVIACGGDPSKHVYGNTTRQRAVAEVEQVVRDVELKADAKGGA